MGEKQEKIEELTDRQAKFVEEYFVDLNATAAYIRLGGTQTHRSAESLAARMMALPVVKAAIAANFDSYKQKIGVTQERVLREMARIAFADVRSLFNKDGSLKDIIDLTEDEAAVIASFEAREKRNLVSDEPVVIKNLKLWDRQKALEFLAKMLLMSKEHVEITGAQGGPVQFEVNMYVPENARDA